MLELYVVVVTFTLGYFMAVTDKKDTKTYKFLDLCFGFSIWALILTIPFKIIFN